MILYWYLSTFFVMCFVLFGIKFGLIDLLQSEFKTKSLLGIQYLLVVFILFAPVMLPVMLVRFFNKYK